MSSHDFESSLEAYPIKLENFEGPLDLLIHLIRRNEVNIYDIPVVLITEQYLAYIELMQELNLDVAGEFLVMAATLIHIKSRLLLPRPAPEQATEDEEDPRDALVRRMVAHQQFKAAAEMLHERETVRSAQWTRSEARLLWSTSPPKSRQGGREKGAPMANPQVAAPTFTVGSLDGMIRTAADVILVDHKRPG